MKVEDVNKAIDLLHEYHFADTLLRKADETCATVTVLNEKIRCTNNESEKFYYRKEISDNIQNLISGSERDGYNFKHDVLMCGLAIAITKLEYKLKELKQKIEQL
ncbi:MAG: hypothetical protein IIX13_09415 [Bacteroidales bacterium]|nr:hypothetical protein [Bacteroidales bacterium]